MLDLVQCPGQYQTCQEYYFNENSRITDLVSKIQSYCEKFSEKSSKSSTSKRSSSKWSLSNSKSSSKNIQFEKAKAKLIVSQAKSNLNIKSELSGKKKLLKLEKEQQMLVDTQNKLQLAQLAEQFNEFVSKNWS